MTHEWKHTMRALDVLGCSGAILSKPLMADMGLGIGSLWEIRNSRGRSLLWPMVGMYIFVETNR